MSERIYLAYGSNINLEQMSQRCPTAKTIATGYLPGYELQFRNVATIVPNDNAAVPVLLWSITEADEKSLDIFEGFPRLYRKEEISFKMDGVDTVAMAYIMNHGKICPPSPGYYECIEHGYKSVGLDTSFLADARKRAMNQSMDFKF